jgi:ubiquinone/menaquinone biosynthesis C-methylase UbiE
MQNEVHSNRKSQVVACVVAGLIVLGFFFNAVGAWTQPILGVWFVGTQKPRRGFFWLLSFAFIPSLITGWRHVPLTGVQHALAHVGLLLFIAVMAVLPLTFHRIVSPRLPGFLATLPFPFAAAVINLLILPAWHSGNADRFGLSRLLILCFATTIVWLWNHESRTTIWVAAVGFTVAVGMELVSRFSGATAFDLAVSGTVVGWASLAGLAALIVVAALRSGKPLGWSARPEALALLRSPSTGSPLHVEGHANHEELVSGSGERFPVRHGIPRFVKPEDLTGDNGKYNHLYETIGGFYNDTQRVFTAFRGLDLDSYFLDYMRLMQVKPGDRVLETSVGTGLNFKYLPRDAKLSGLDLSAEMLSSCQDNLRRWSMEADLYLGNAESLPFGDASFDVVYTAGAINFFNDRAKAIREMIRVAKPGGLLLVEDETEEYVQSTYEKIPYASKFFKDRTQPVTVPVDLVPPEMENIQVKMLKQGRFYAITFRKPASVCSVVPLGITA